MINKVIDAICNVLYEEFGDDYKIYTDTVEQDLKAPCFSVFCISPMKKQFFGKKYKVSNLYMVLYFPKDENEPSYEINEVIERLYNCLEYIKETDDLIRGIEMSGEVIDDVLNFKVKYEFFTYQSEKGDPMEELSETSIAKG